MNMPQVGEVIADRSLAFCFEAQLPLALWSRRAVKEVAESGRCRGLNKLQYHGPGYGPRFCVFLWYRVPERDLNMMLEIFVGSLE